MLIKKSQAKEFTIEGGTKGIIYPSSPKQDQTLASVEIEGVYPKEGYSLNDIATETIYVQEGTLTLEVNKEVFHLEPGDLYMILPGNKYRLEGKAKCHVFISPSWEKNINTIVKE